jgi:hypothetical protein
MRTTQVKMEKRQKSQQLEQEHTKRQLREAGGGGVAPCAKAAVTGLFCVCVPFRADSHRAHGERNNEYGIKTNKKRV